jgi:hypothetical protein
MHITYTNISHTNIHTSHVHECMHAIGQSNNQSINQSINQTNKQTNRQTASTCLKADLYHKLLTTPPYLHLRIHLQNWINRDLEPQKPGSQPYDDRAAEEGASDASKEEDLVAIQKEMRRTKIGARPRPLVLIYFHVSSVSLAWFHWRDALCQSRSHPRFHLF